MNTSLFDTMQNRLIAAGVSPDLFVGCTSEQINELKLAQGVTRLPPLYEQYLRRMGVSPGMAFSGDSSLTFPGLLGNKHDALHILEEEHSPLQLPSGAFIFFVHDQGYQFQFFITEEGNDDPPIFEWTDGPQAFKVKVESLSAYISRSFEHWEYAIGIRR